MVNFYSTLIPFFQDNGGIYMNVVHINAITAATKSILQNHFGLEVTPLRPTAGQSPVSSNQVSVILGVSGQLEGQIICSFTFGTAKKIVGVMMGGMDIQEIDDIGWSAVQEFGNWVAGTTATELSKADCIIDVTPPFINEGDSKFRSTKTFISVPLQTTIGELVVHISVKEK